MTEVTIRPMRPDDVPEAERLSAECFLEFDRRTRRLCDPEPQPRSGVRRADWLVRTHHLLETDPGGCWVADDDSGMIGMATSFVRDKTWCLATYAVRPRLQSRGIGKQLLDAALHHGRGCLRGMLSASSDPRAVRRYRLAGFSLHPQMHLTGTVDRSAIPVIEKVRDGSAADTDLMNSIDRQVRGAAHGPNHELMQQLWRPIVSDSTTGSGYAYLAEGRVELLAATTRAAATRLLWAAIADGGAEHTVAHLTDANEWAIDVGLAARLELRTEGYLALRGMSPPSPYVHHGALL
ncbi:GNAT family N-acetyltransferase [Nocardioides sp. cx-169]|uniref:GNAT family N-acetyltransferase n=1 Tax=Nocardioides sp. cx-169 TaxID=2899080 RepID=UPI001E2E082B|nr:GNAT family N-acetyltransferase [Nocardioides sp. cx-169]MCD4534658.1 GNAT family N-acetyltransferase [Nocardioides sp. cx-169]